MKQWCLEEAAPQGSGIWREQRCKTWYLEEVAPLKQQCLKGREQWGEKIPGGSSGTEHGTWRTWHHGGPVPVDISAMGNGASWEWRCGETAPGESNAGGEWYLG